MAGMDQWEHRKWSGFGHVGSRGFTGMSAQMGRGICQGGDWNQWTKKKMVVVVVEMVYTNGPIHET